MVFNSELYPGFPVSREHCVLFSAYIMTLKKKKVALPALGLKSFSLDADIQMKGEWES